MRKDLSKLILVLGASFSLVSCASSQTTTGELEINDPFEDFNRAVFAFNGVVDDVVVDPVVMSYKEIVPTPAQRGVTNFLRNLKSPVRFANQLLQGDVDGAGNVLLRTVVNTLIGVGGLFDVAGAEGYEYESEDFGQTLGVWGVGHGPYIVVPFLGPSSMRDYAGYAVDSFADPVRWYLHNDDRDNTYYAKLGADYLDLRASLHDALQDMETNSIDYYAAVRSAYYQSRDSLLHDRADTAQPLPEFPEYDDY